MKSLFEIKAILGPDRSDDKEVVILGRLVKWGTKGIEYEADPKHRRMTLEFFGFDDKSNLSSVNGDREDKFQRGDAELLSSQEAKEYR
eukprot:10892400-Karenia_brevis.AAC.1